MFKPTLNITERIADHLAQRVIFGELDGGARIQELKIANELGVSRGSVREALLILERRYLIEIVPRKGAVVNCIDAKDALELVEMLTSVEQRWFHQLIASPQSRDCIAAAAGILPNMERAAREGRLEAVLRARKDFYDALLGPATRYVSGMFECLLPSSQRLIRLLVVQAHVDLHDIARYYRALFGAVESADGERLDELLNAFRKRLHALCVKTFGDPGARPAPGRDLLNHGAAAGTAGAG